MPAIIRPIAPADTAAVLAMMHTFYASPAVYTSGSEAIFRRDIETCLSGSPYLEGVVFEVPSAPAETDTATMTEAPAIAGYAMVARSFSTEFGKPCIWLEDIYIRETYRGHGLGSMFLTYIQEKYPDAIFRLEVEEENEGAVRLYRRYGFDVLPYMEMKK